MENKYLNTTQATTSAINVADYALPKPAEVLKTAKELLSNGIVKVCSFPITAINEKGQNVAPDHQEAVAWTVAGALMRSLSTSFGAGINIDLQPYFNHLANQMPEVYTKPYDLPLALDLVCLNKSDEEILQAFDRAIINAA